MVYGMKIKIIKGIAKMKEQKIRKWKKDCNERIFFMFFIVILTNNKENEYIEHPSVSNDHKQKWDIREPSDTRLAGVLILLIVLED